MKKIMTLLMFILAIVLAACGGQPDQKSTQTEDVDLANLPIEVDVQTTAILQNNSDVVLIDVREQWEYDEAHIPGITLIPMSEIENRLSDIPQDKTVIMTCRSGNRSGQITDLLRQNGYNNIHTMTGGILAWQQAGFEVEK